MSTAKAVKPLYDPGEKVLCYHHAKLYGAKCTAIEPDGKGYKYYIHYEGWSKSWDDWVEEDRIVKLNDAGLKKQAELEKANPTTKGKKGAKGGPMALKNEGGSRCSTPVSQDGAKQKSSRASTGSDPSEPKKKKAKTSAPTESAVDDNVEYNNHRSEVKVKLPDDLKRYLVDDWDMITHQYKLVTLPCKQTVKQILSDYLKSKSNIRNPIKFNVVEEVVKGITAYFDDLLGTQLLYKFERLQYAEFMQVEREKQPLMSEVYGFAHLLRLFVRLGHMLAYTSLSEKNISMVLGHVQDLLKYLQKNQVSLFNPSDYAVATPDYQRRAFTS